MGQARFTEIPASTKSILTLVLSFPGVWYRKSYLILNPFMHNVENGQTVQKSCGGNTA